MQQNVFNALLSNGFLRYFLDFFSHGTLEMAFFSLNEVLICDF